MYKLILGLLVFFSVQVSAQDPTKIVNWKTEVKPGEAANQYIFTLSARIDSGWHVFAPVPGGDGLLIPTEIIFEDHSPVSHQGPLVPERKPVTRMMDGVGMVNYYEGEIRFTMKISTEKSGALKGKISYQCCNENMCLPPAEVPFSVKP
ncbi:MAG TPA: protein-disulfide reductase DsbD family protein [Chitinophagaceae bacterium]|nr:protein-disulfide reductase DsbD family protein [Chitinophagaceae bacterium]HNF71922.1 protein-disulfide reductase DsbD family protein [Chitinophagaceae bacterium]